MNSLNEVQPNTLSGPPPVSSPNNPGMPPPSYSSWNGPVRSSTAPAADPRSKSPALATFLSLMPGLGQVYVGYYRQGFVNITVVCFLIAVLNIDNLHHSALVPFLGLFLSFFWLFNLVDAQRRAVYCNQRMAQMESFEMPDSFKNISKEGNLGSGILLILIGVLGLAHTIWDMPLDWLRDWWPLAVVGFGAFLVGHALWDYRRSGK